MDVEGKNTQALTTRLSRQHTDMAVKRRMRSSSYIALFLD